MTSPEDQIPDHPALGDALSKAWPAPAVPPSVDREVLDAASLRFGRVRARRRWWRRATTVSAAAAILVVALVGIDRRTPEPDSGKPAGIADVDGDGRVDIVDAYVLDRARRAGSPPGAMDVNRDGRVDVRDVDAVARRAVSLQPEGR